MAARGYESADEAWTKYVQGKELFDGIFMAGVFSYVERAQGTKAHFTGSYLSGQRCSFSYETPIFTTDGYQPIGDLEIGDYVLAYNEETGEITYYPVTATWVHIDPVIVYLTIDGETLETTPNHPFYTSQGEWVVAGLLEVGDEVRTANWGVGRVEAITFLAQPQFMYNLTVDTAHTYFVGDGQWLVHNICIKDVPTLGQPGNNKGNRIVNGTLADAEQMFNELTVGASSKNIQPNGAILATMPDGSYITFRSVGSVKSGFVPTINVHSPQIGYWGIKFIP